MLVEVVNFLLAAQVNGARVAGLRCLLRLWLAEGVQCLRGLLGQLRAVDLHDFVHPQVRSAVAWLLFADCRLLLHALLGVVGPAAEVVRAEHVSRVSEAVGCAVSGLSGLAFLLLEALLRRTGVVLLLDFRRLVAVPQCF